MPLQLLFTSAPQGLTPGRSGYCTVARHRAVPERLAQLLEAIGTPHERSDGATFTFRVLEAGGGSWYVLSRFVARGLDYTQRDNRLAHHLVFSAEEAATLPPPAAIAARWSGWQTEWSGSPAWLDGEDRPLKLEAYPPLAPAIAWREATGTGAKAAWLVNASGAAAVGLVNPPETSALLRLLAESSALIGKAAWHATFTTDARATGAEGFQWAAHHAGGSLSIDLAVAAALPAPSGELARQAAVGPTSPRAAAAAPTRSATPAKDGGSSILAWIIGASLLLAVTAAVFVIAGKAGDPAPAPPKPTAAAPAAVDSAQADAILRANQAVTEIQSLLEGDDLLAAGRLWLEISARSPKFVANYREQVLPRLLRDYAASIAQQLQRRLDRPGFSTDIPALRALGAEVAEAVRIGNELGVPRDAAWSRLGQIGARVTRLLSLDIRPVLLIAGEWRTAGTGAGQPSQAEFPLARHGVDALTAFVEQAGATLSRSVPIRIRLLDFETPHQRDDKTKSLSGEIRRTSQTTWIESTPEPGRLPAIGIGLGSRRNVVSLNFPDHAGARADVNRLIEITLPDGRRQCVALLGDTRSLKPLDLGPGALVADAGTGVIRTATWAEPAAQAFVWTQGATGLYPDGHEFPDRDLPSVRASRSLVETDLNRLERKQGPSAPPFETLEARRKLLQDGRLVEAGAPWSLRAINADGSAGPHLLELR